MNNILNKIVAAFIMCEIIMWKTPEKNENSEQLKNLEKNKNPERKAFYWLIRKHS